MKNSIKLEKHTSFFATFSPSSFTSYKNKYHNNTTISQKGCFIQAFEISQILSSSNQKTFISSKLVPRETLEWRRAGSEKNRRKDKIAFNILQFKEDFRGHPKLGYVLRNLKNVRRIVSQGYREIKW